jgi:hypothetical protein
MPRAYQSAAKSTREMAARRQRNLWLNGLLAIGGIIVVYLLLSNSKQFGIGGIGFLILLFLLRLIPDWFDSYSRRQSKAIRQAERGADAEEEIADLLGELDDDFFDVINDVESPFGNIDHIVISQRGGVILLETKSHHGTVTIEDGELLINGKEPEKDFIDQALSNSLWLRDEIEDILHVKPWVNAFVVFTNAFVKSGKPIQGVRVINQKFLLNSIERIQSSNSVNTVIWSKRDRILAYLSGEEDAPNVNDDEPAQFCPKCGKKLVLKVAKGGEQVGKSFMVCPDYPKCHIAIPVDKEENNLAL